MAATVTSTVKSGTATAGTTHESGNITPSGSGRVLYALVGCASGVPSIPTAVKFGGSGGTSMTQIGTTISIGAVRTSLWRLVNPAASAGTIYADWGGASQDEKWIRAVAVQDGDPDGTPNGTVAQTTGTNTTPSVSATTVSGDLVLDFVDWVDLGSSRTIAADGSQTSLLEQEAGEISAFVGGGSSRETATTTSTTMSWTISGSVDNWGIYAFNVNSGATSSTDQEGFRFGADDGSESAHGWLAAQDTNIYAQVGDAVLLRALVNATGDPASAAYTLRAQKNGAGGYTAVPVGTSTTTAPTVEAADVTSSGNNTATTSWAVSYPAYVNGDLLVFHVASDANVTHDWPTTGPNSETINTIQDSLGDAATANQRVSGFWFVGSATTIAGTLTVTPSATEQWTAEVLKVLAGEFNSTTPIQTTVGTASDSTADTSWDTPAWTADATAGGRVVCFAGHDVVTTTATPTGWTTLAATDRGAIGCTLASRDAANTASESIASASFTKTSETDASFGYIINGAVVTNEIYIATSANIAAGGEATTARLTAPSGKTTADFVTGRRWDDENGTDTIDITTDDYTEVEWSLDTQSPAVNGDYWDFRVYAGGSALTTYTVTPRLTMGTAPTPSSTAAKRLRMGRARLIQF